MIFVLLLGSVRNIFLFGRKKSIFWSKKKNEKSKKGNGN